MLSCVAALTVALWSVLEDSVAGDMGLRTGMEKPRSRVRGIISAGDIVHGSP